MAFTRAARAMGYPDRFMSNVAPEPMSGCWLWTGALANGYPSMCMEGKAQKMHRYSYSLFKGPIRPDEECRHLCHNPACVNPAHLDKGTTKQNRFDSLKDGRLNQKLTDEQVKSMYAEYVPYEIGLWRLAKKYGCSKRNVLDIVKGRKFRHLTVGATE